MKKSFILRTVLMSLFLLTNFISAQSVISDVQCANNGTFEDATDDYVIFKLNPFSPSSTFVSTDSYNLTATFAGNPVTVTFLNNAAATNVLYRENNYFKIPTGALGSGNFTVTLTPNFGGFGPENVTFANPGTCSNTCSGASLNNVVTQYYYSPRQDPDFSNSPIIIPKFQAGSNRVLTKVKVDYGVDFGGSLSITNPNPVGVNYRVLLSLDLTFALAGYSFSNTLNVLKNPSYPGTNPIAASGTVTISDNGVLYNNTATYTSAADLSNFLGTTNLSGSFDTLTNAALQGGGGNLSSAITLRGGFYYKVEYTYNCLPSVCYEDPNTTTSGPATKHGITLLSRAGADNGNWPMIRKSAHTALESNTKGFVITRMTTAQVTAIVSPQEGMMVYDTTAKCLKLYDGTAWSCFNTPACP